MASNPLQQKILDKIRAGDLSMRPRYYFALKLGALALLSVAILLVSVFIFNFMLFSIRISSQDALLGFGSRGLVAFIAFFPWTLAALDAGLVLVLQWLLREFRLGYKIPILYVIAGLLLATVALGFAIDRGTGLNDELFERSERHELPGLDNVYGRARWMPPPDQGVCRCTIVAIDRNTLTVFDAHSSTTLSVLVPQDDPYATTSGLSVGDTVFIAGDADGDDDIIIRAFGIRKLPTGGPGPHPRPQE